MKKQLWFGALAIALAVVIISGCASIGRPLEAKLHAKLMPADRQAAQTELALDEAQIAKLEANVDQLRALMTAYPKLDTARTERVYNEISANIDWYHQRITEITAILPTLPERTVEAGPTPALEPAP